MPSSKDLNKLLKIILTTILVKEHEITLKSYILLLSLLEYAYWIFNPVARVTNVDVLGSKAVLSIDYEVRCALENTLNEAE